MYKTAGKILVSSLVESWKSKLCKLAYSIDGLNTIFLIGKNYLEMNIPDSVVLGAKILFIIILIPFFLILIKNIFKHLQEIYTESKYGDAIIIMKNIFSKVHELRKKQKLTKTEIMECLAYLCNELKRLFEQKSTGKCSVSIKVAVGNGQVFLDRKFHTIGVIC